MHALRIAVAAALVGVLATAGCGREPHAAGSEDPPVRPVGPAPQRPARAAVPPPSAADSALARARVAARELSVRAAFERGSALGAREVAELRQDRNAEQVATARSMGLRVSGGAEIRELRRQGRLVELGDSTDHWVLREMEHSVPIVTPDTRAMLEELGRRFHARLDSLGLPRYRIKVTSALRTDQTQKELRRTNSYASRTASAHEFGTTVDVSHERFAVPAAPDTAGMPEIEQETLEQMGDEHSRVLQAELGRAIAGMRTEGALHVMMENRQPVYHITVARRYTSGR